MGNAEGGCPKQDKQELADSNEHVAGELHHVYLKKMYPVEKRTFFHDIHNPELGVEDFSAKPMVLVLGQYSTGKTTFLQQMLGRDYPGIRISPEPTTDKFICLVHGQSASIDEGHVVVADPSLPFSSLASFGDAFLSNLECIRIPRQAGHKRVLEDLMLIDTPGVLSGDKEGGRGYDFVQVTSWFADHVDMILVFFDVSKLDIADEMKALVRAVKSKNGHKVQIVLNKADQVDTTSLMRIYGALMWNLRSVFETPEVPRVYIGSFWDKPLKHDEQRAILDDDKRDLDELFRQLGRNANVRKLNMLIKRAKKTRAHAYVLDYLASSTPRLCRKESWKNSALSDLTGIYVKLGAEFKLPVGDFPDAKTMKEHLSQYDMAKLPRLDKAEIENLDNFIKHDLPFLLKQLPEQMQADIERERWLKQPNETEYKRDFNKLEPKNGKVPTAKALASARISADVMQQIRHLIGNTEEDGQFTLIEFAYAMQFVGMVREGHSLPEVMPEAMRAPTLARPDERRARRRWRPPCCAS